MPSDHLLLHDESDFWLRFFREIVRTTQLFLIQSVFDLADKKGIEFVRLHYQLRISTVQV